MSSKRHIFWIFVLAFALCGQGWAAQTVLRYGVYSNAPKVFVDAQGQPAGIFPDLLREMAAKQGWTLTPVQCEWSSCLRMLEAGDIDFMPDVAETPERRERFDFHGEPMLHSWSQVYAGAGQKFDSLLDLKGKHVVVLRDSVQDRYLRELKVGLGVAFELIEVDSIDQGFKLVSAGQADAVASNHHYGDLQAMNYGLRPTSIIMLPAALYLAASKHKNLQTELGLIDKQLERWKADDNSYYYQVLYKWSSGGDLQYRLSPTVIWVLAGTFAALLLALFFGFMLKKQVKRVTADLQNSRDELNTILDSVGAHVYIKDTDLRYQYANKQVQELWGKSLAEIKGKGDSDFFDAETAQKLAENDQWILSRGERLVAEEFNTLRGSEGVQVFLSVKIPLRDTTGKIYGLCGISTDLTQNKQVQDEMHALAYYDALTHLPNRRLLMDRLEQSLAVYERSRRNGALVVLDVDGFSLVNNTLGHDAGDLILKQVAQRLLSAVRSEDTIARSSSDEFVVLLHDLSVNKDEAAQQTQVVLKKIREVFKDSYPINSHRQAVTASMGVAFFSDSGKDADEIFRLADIALHQAKAEGPGSLRFFNHAMQISAKTRADLETDMRVALVRNEFYLEYQPQVAPDGRVLGVEALVRWRHPVKGVVSPVQFIGVAESSALIIPLGHWILEQACNQIASWKNDEALSSWTISVNVSARQFQQEGFVDEVLELLRSTHANPHRLELELTESILVSDVNLVDSKMSQLASHGVKFALDDFGTGYSSLNYLKRLPLNKLKIDKSFIDELNTDAHSEAIVRTIVSLAQNLSMSVIAEGVETKDQVEALKAIGVIEYQGYYFAKPLAHDAVVAWQREYRSASR